MNFKEQILSDDMWDLLWKKRVLDSFKRKNNDNLIARSGNNRVTRIGICNDIALALRVPFGAYNQSEENSRIEVETYSFNAGNLYDGGNRNLSRFAIPILCSDSNTKKYALLVEDLTDWGINQLMNHSTGDVMADQKLIDGRSRGVFVDLGPRSYRFLEKKNDFYYTSNDLCINLLEF